MWFRNVQVFRAAEALPDAAQLAAALAAQAFVPCGALDAQSQGWVAPRAGADLVHVVGRQWLLRLRTEKKLLPAAVIRARAQAMAAEVEQQQGFRPGRKQMKEITEAVTDLLLPQAFSTCVDTGVWIDPGHGWMAIDSPSAARADDVFRLLLQVLGRLPFAALRTAHAPMTAMTGWLTADEAPAGFTIDQDTELRAGGDGRATVRYVRHTPEVEDVTRQIASGKQCTRLALTWSDRISFVLTDALALKRVAPLDVLKESADSTAPHEDERFDSDFSLMTGELHLLLTDLVGALGGVAAD